jgi:uncharacterized protein YndB with AHSA1/START domain
MATFSLTIAAPPREVFDYIVEPRNRPQWQASLRRVEPLDDGRVGVGTAWVDHTAVGAKPHLRIIEFQRPGEAGEVGVWREVGTWHGLRADLAMRFESTERPESAWTADRARSAASPGTLITGTVEITGPLWWLPARVVLQTLAPLAVRSDLRRAARILASG